MPKITLRVLRNTRLDEIYSKLLTGANVNDNEKIQLLKIAILLLNCGNQDLEKMGYRIIVMYANKFEDYEPLYDVSIALGYIPISKVIEDSYPNRRDHFFGLFQSSFKETFKQNSIYLTRKQRDIFSLFREKSTKQSTAVIAPTSYGKSELLIGSIDERKNTCILVPTKALLAQTKSRILEQVNSDQKIITHPEMYNSSDQNVIAILTQERLLKLLQIDPELCFDVVYVDEAHNLLSDDLRNRLLACAVILLKSRNKNVELCFVSPFLTEVSNLKTRIFKYDIRELRIDEYVKTERLYYCDLRKCGQLQIYDQFLNKFFDCDAIFSSEERIINEKSGGKNIIYFNRPAQMEKFLGEYTDTLSLINNSDLEKDIQAIEEFLHSDYNLLKCLRRGVVYHHGSVPDTIKLFVENLYVKYPFIRFLATTSTLLEGVNVPAEKLFLMEHKKGLRKLKTSHFRNLIGRVCRFREVFGSGIGMLRLLEPEIYILGSRFTGDNVRLDKFLEDVMKVDKNVNEKPENIMLENSGANENEIHERQRYDEYLQNIEPEIIKDQNIRVAVTEFGKSCFLNNVMEFDVIDKESRGQKIVDKMTRLKIVLSTTNEVLETINDLFLKLIDDEQNEKNLLRLRNDSGARNFYALLLQWRVDNLSFKQMIGQIMNYWEKRISAGTPHVYVGKWGEIRKGGRLNHWIDLSMKSRVEKVNLAIVRIKEEQDFVENKLMNFIEVLNELALISEDLYLKIKYGTNNKYKILLIKSGLSLSLSNLLLAKYRTHLKIELDRNIVTLDEKVIEEMKMSNENRLLIFEASFNVQKL